MTSEELEKSLRTEVDGYINSRLTSMHEEIERLQSQTNEAFTRLLERSSDETQANTSLAVAILEHIRAAHERGVEEAAASSSRAQASSDVAILKSAIDELDNQRSQADILSMLVNRAASFAPRVAFFVVKGGQVIGWRARGLEGTVGDEAVRDIALALAADTLLSDAINSRATWSGSPGGHADDYALVNKLGDEPPQRIVSIPLIARGKAAAVLYADSAALEPDAINLEALEILVRVAGMSVELLAVSRPAPSETRAVEDQPQEEEASAPSPVQTEAEQPAETWQAPSETPADDDNEYATKGAAVEPAAQQAEETSWEMAAPVVEAEAAPPPEAEEEAQEEAVPVEPEAMPVEPETMYEAMPVSVEPEPASQSDSSSFQYEAATAGSRNDVELPVNVSDDERRLHNDAHRFARLLVSEIKLYNEQKVSEGRQGANLYDRLREPIDRSREMYNKRVASSVATSYDYFHHELVNTLAEGDESKLGANYPGASVKV